MSGALALVPVAQDERLNTREDVLQRKGQLRLLVDDMVKEAKTHPVNSPDRNRLYSVIQDNHAEQAELESVLQAQFVPQHSPKQLISPRAFFVSPLFRVCSKRLTREDSVAVELKSTTGQVLFRYVGPELRQSDGLVFMALLNLVRDVRAGQSVSFHAEDICKLVFGRYDGPTRSRLRDHIKRLQRGLMEFEHFSVQLAQRFEYPSTGPWNVALDKDIVQVFQRSPQVWLDLQRRQALPEGLTTWLYSFVESQTKLIPMSISTLKQLCGSDATEESFPRTLRLALKELNEHGVIDEGWSMTKGVVHWRKPKVEYARID